MVEGTRPSTPPGSVPPFPPPPEVAGAGVLVLLGIADQASTWWAWRHLNAVLNGGSTWFLGSTVSSWCSGTLPGALLDVAGPSALSLALGALLRRRRDRGATDAVDVRTLPADAGAPARGRPGALRSTAARRIAARRIAARRIAATRGDATPVPGAGGCLPWTAWATSARSGVASRCCPCVNRSPRPPRPSGRPRNGIPPRRGSRHGAVQRIRAAGR